MNIKVYSTPTCPYCTMVKKFLRENNVEFEDIDVSSDRNAAQELIDKSAQTGVPVIDIDGSIIVGFNKPKLKEALHLQ